jgi:TetR/AcrR family transcriptional repressor of lmrAB and yxaGH operons
MAAPRTDTRDRIIRSAARLFQRQGYLGTGLVQVVEECAAPRGSIYFHFRGGKEELALEVIELWERDTVTLLERCVERTHGVPGALVLLAQTLADTMQRSGFVQGCAVSTMALEVAPACETLREACDRLFREWQGTLRRHFVAAGLSEGRGEALASLVVSTLEGALILARTNLNTAPLIIAGQELANLVSASLAISGQERTSDAAQDVLAARPEHGGRMSA